MPRVVNGVIMPKKKGYEQIDQYERDDDREPAITIPQCCHDSTCICSCGNFQFRPSMLWSLDAMIGYGILLITGLISYFASWKIGLIIFVICFIGYSFWLNYRCCGERRNGQNDDRSNQLNPNRRGGVKGMKTIADLPKPPKKGG